LGVEKLALIHPSDSVVSSPLRTLGGNDASK